jgi:hypothetical protein
MGALLDLSDKDILYKPRQEQVLRDFKKFDFLQVLNPLH